MEIVIRVDASTSIGTGHLMRCLTLANLLKDAGADVALLTRELPGGLSRLISEHFSHHVLKENAQPTAPPVSGDDAIETVEYLAQRQRPEWIIVDHYSLGLEWERQLRSHVGKIMVIDDLANRPHDCDLLLDQNFCRNFQIRYDRLVPAGARRLLGPTYALLRPEFYEERDRLQTRDGKVRSILISFGGADPTNETAKAFQAMSLLQAGTRLEVVLGEANTHAEAISSLYAGLANVHIHRNPSNMAELMARVDLAIGAPGATTWERCFLGLPAIGIVLAENQEPVGEAVAAAGAMINLGWHDKVSSKAIAQAVNDLVRRPEVLRQMSKAAFSIMEQNRLAAGRNELLQAILKV